MKLKIYSIVCLFITVSYSLLAQINSYRYQQELVGVSDQWHSLELPNAVFSEVEKSLADIRIYGITSANDTIETPYILKVKEDQIEQKIASFNILNTSQNENGYYFTLELKSDEPVNQIDLSFGAQNFDWRVDLEGSQNQTEWFSVLEDYRILSIYNAQTKYSFTQLNFPDSKYKYFRILVKSNKKPSLRVAEVSKHTMAEGEFNKFEIKQLKSYENIEAKRTEIEVDLKQPSSLSRIKVSVKNDFDYYRPIEIKYLVDSVKSEKGWKYNYRNLISGTLNSIEENEFYAADKIVEKLKILIYNNDNEPLAIGGIEVKGHVHELIIRMTEPAVYYLTYGNKDAHKPTYDINRFQDRIPKKLTQLSLGEIRKTMKTETQAIEPLFASKVWLWGIMLVIISLLGWFSFKMMGKN